MLNKIFGGRKAFGFIFLTIVGTVIEVTKVGGLSEQFVALVVALFGTYAAGNVITKKVSKPSEDTNVTKKLEVELTKLRNDAASEIIAQQGQIAELSKQMQDLASGSDDTNVREIQSQVSTIIDNMSNMSDNLSKLQKRVKALMEITGAS